MSRNFFEYTLSPTVAIKAGQKRTFYLHKALLDPEVKRLYSNINGEYEIAEEDFKLFGHFVDYLYQNCSILSIDSIRPKDLVTLARLRVLSDRIEAQSFGDVVSWRLGRALTRSASLPDNDICELLQIASIEMQDENTQARIYWYAASQITRLQKCERFRQLIRTITELGGKLCLWVLQVEPSIPRGPSFSTRRRFMHEIESTSQHEPMRPNRLKRIIEDMRSQEADEEGIERARDATRRLVECLEEAPATPE